MWGFVIGNCKINVAVPWPQGLHLRIASELVEMCSQHQAHIMFHCNQRQAAGKDLLALLALGAGYQSQLTVHIQGPMAQQTAQSIKHWFAGFRPTD